MGWGTGNIGGGSGGGLNFKVVGNPQPANPKENTIWVETDVDITSYVFSATEPETPKAGMLWVKISDSSNIKVGTPLGKDYITIMLNSVSQYVGGAWVDKVAKSYQGGEWVGWTTHFYKEGNQHTDVTGGWTHDGLYWGSNPAAVITTPTFNSASISITRTGGNPGAIATKNSIDLKCKSLCMRYSLTGTSDNNTRFGITLSNDIAFDSETKNIPACVQIPNATNGVVSVPVDTVSQGRIFVANCNASGKLSIFEIWGV